MNKATVKVSKFNATSSKYELQRTLQVEVQEAEQLENYLYDCISIPEFYMYEISYPDNRYVIKYTCYADALGIIRAVAYQKKNIETAVL